VPQSYYKTNNENPNNTYTTRYKRSLQLTARMTHYYKNKKKLVANQTHTYESKKYNKAMKLDTSKL